MAGIMNIGEMGALALHSMLEIAKKHYTEPQSWISVTELADTLKASRHTLHKVIKQLVEAGLLESSRGAHGGVKLLAQPKTITLIMIIEAVDGTFHTRGCMFARRICSETSLCQFCDITHDLERTISRYFTTTTLETLVSRLGS